MSAQPDSFDFAASGRRVFAVEADALAAVAARVDGAFSAACRAMLACRGRVVCTGMGKSGHVARKIAATLASTGTPAFYMHPGEAAHGDLGMVTDADVLLALSYSGESDELLLLLPALKRQGNTVIAMTGRPQSTLAGEADGGEKQGEEETGFHGVGAGLTQGAVTRRWAVSAVLLRWTTWSPSWTITFQPRALARS